MNTTTAWDISKKISHISGRRLSDVQNILLVQRLRLLRISDYNSYNSADVELAIIESMSSYLDGKSKHRNEIDIHAYLKNTITSDYSAEKSDNITNFIDKNDTPIVFQTADNKKNSVPLAISKHFLDVNSVFDISDIHKIQRIIAPKSLYKYMYIMLDTANAINTVATDTRFKWDFISNGLLQTGAVNAVGKIRDLVGMRVFPVHADLLSTPTVDFTESGIYSCTSSSSSLFSGMVTWASDYVNLNNNFTVLIHEFSAQSFIGREGRKFHFVFFPSLQNASTKTNYSYQPWTPTNPEYEMLTSGKGNGWYWFRTPITSFSSLTMSMANPFTEIAVNKTTRTLIPIELIYLSSSDE